MIAVPKSVSQATWRRSGGEFMLLAIARSDITAIVAAAVNFYLARNSSIQAKVTREILKLFSTDDEIVARSSTNVNTFAPSSMRHSGSLRRFQQSSQGRCFREVWEVKTSSSRKTSKSQLASTTQATARMSFQSLSSAVRRTSSTLPKTHLVTRQRTLP